VKLYLKGNDQASAERATEVQLASIKGSSVGEKLLESVSHWEGVPKPKRKLSTSSVTLLLLQLFESPASIAATSASKCLTVLGADVIKLATRHSSIDETILHDFHSTVFQKEVLTALEAKYKENLFEIVRWYHRRDDLTNATDYANKYIRYWSEKELIAVVLELKLHPGGLLREFGRRDKLVTAVDVFLRGGDEYLSSAAMVSDMALSSPAQVEHCGDELLIVWRNADATKTRAALSENKAPKISAFLHLFDHTREASRTRAKEYLKLFGKTTIRKAVFSSRIYKEEDIKPVLARFHESFNLLCPMEMINLFRDFGGESANEQQFVHANLSRWTNAELSDIVRNETSVRSHMVVEELARRALFLLCMEIALEKRKIPEAICHADCELSVTTWANAFPTLTLWRRFIIPGDSTNTMVLAGSSPFSTLLRLREDALSLMRSNKAVRIIASYGPSFVGYAIRFNGMPDDFAAFPSIKVFHESLLEGICKKVTQRLKKTPEKKTPKPSIINREAKSGSSSRSEGEVERLCEFDHELLSVIEDTDVGSRIAAKGRAAGDSKQEGNQKEKKKQEDTDAGSRVVANDHAAGDSKKRGKRKGKKKRGKR
jgi:hypothetical protein